MSNKALGSSQYLNGETAATKALRERRHIPELEVKARIQSDRVPMLKTKGLHWKRFVSGSTKIRSTERRWGQRESHMWIWPLTLETYPGSRGKWWCFQHRQLQSGERSQWGRELLRSGSADALGDELGGSMRGNFKNPRGRRVVGIRRKS